MDGPPSIAMLKVPAYPTLCVPAGVGQPGPTATDPFTLVPDEGGLVLTKHAFAPHPIRGVAGPSSMPATAPAASARRLPDPAKRRP